MKLSKSAAESLLIIVAAFFGINLGTIAAYIIAGGPNFEQLPIVTAPIGIAIAVLLAIIPIYTPKIRLIMMAVALIVSSIILRFLI